jgi:6-phosphogluconolactonase/glucosamine-6-phosphate isomerase/deaminase
MTITPPVVERARSVVLLVAGPQKAPMVGRMLAGDRSVVASRVIGPRTVVVADRDAAPVAR